MISILATGSRGDTQPYIALGVALKKAGKQVRVAAFENYESFVREHGLNFFPIRGDIEMVAKSESVKKSRNADNPLKVVLGFRELQKLVFEVQEDFYRACEDSEAVIYHPGAAIGYFAAQKMGIPAIFAPPFPMAPTSEYPAIIFYGKVPSNRAINLLTHKVFSQIMWSTVSSPIKSYWMKKFGTSPENFGNPFARQNSRRYPTIISSSKHIFPVAGSDLEYVTTTGYWFLDESDQWAPPSELTKFLEEGEKPVYLGFGSTGLQSTGDLTEMMIEGLRLAGKRGIVATGWGGLKNQDVASTDILFIQSAPHSWLFPRVQAVIHHGGAGTTAAGLRAGVPSIIIPFSNDQFSWGKRVFDLEVGSEPLSHKNLTAQKLADAICQATSMEIIENSKILGEKINAEDGVSNAVKVVLRALE